MNFSGAEEAGYGTRLKNDTRRKQNKEVGFKFEGHIIYDTGYNTGKSDIEDFIFYSK